MSKKINITIETGNAAFDDDNESVELSCILRGMALKIYSGALGDMKIYDSNGNSVGQMVVTELGDE